MSARSVRGLWESDFIQKIIISQNHERMRICKLASPQLPTSREKLLSKKICAKFDWIWSCSHYVKIFTSNLEPQMAERFQNKRKSTPEDCHEPWSRPILFFLLLGNLLCQLQFKAWSEGWDQCSHFIESWILIQLEINRLPPHIYCFNQNKELDYLWKI